MTPIHDTADLVSKALRRAWQLGQTYWQQADSEYQSHWKKADATQATFDQLVEDTRAAILSSNSGAQPASIEQDTSVRKAWARFSHELNHSPDAPYPGMSEAFEQHFSQSFTDREWRAESATWAAAWKAAKRHEAQAQPAPSTEYVGWYCAHCERGVDASEVTYHEQHQVCGRIITDDKPPKPAPSASEGWMRAIDEALLTAHIGVANAHDTYEQAKAKIDNLIGFYVDIATDPAVNGGYKLVPTEPTTEMICEMERQWMCGSQIDMAKREWKAACAAAPEAKS